MIKKLKQKAFSLIELALVLLIIGVIIAGIFAGNFLIKKARISTARTLTNSSAVHSIKDLSLWLESSLESSFLSGESSNKDPISIWNDIGATNRAINATQNSSSNMPVFSNSIEKIHAVKFDGTNDYFEFDGSFLNGSDYTIIITDKRLSNKSDNYFLGDSSVDSENENILLGYKTNGVITHSHTGSNSYDSTISSYENSNDEARIFTFIQDSFSGKSTYINGLLAASDSDTTRLTNIGTLRIGNEYNGEIGEIVIFSRALRNPERRDIEDYLSKKWSTPVNTNSSSCTTGVITSSGCETPSACSISVAGSSTSSVDNGSGTVTCDSTGYSGTASYNCSDGSLSSVGSCSCASGYTLISGTCQADCSVSEAGVTTSSVSALSGSSTLSCDDTGYDSSDSITYTCSGGTFSVTSGSCDTCDTGYVLSGGVCVESCSGGTIDTTSDPGKTIHTFTSGTATFSCPTTKNVEVLVVAGGGGGSSFRNNGGGTGGGAGGLIYDSSYSITGGSDITVTIGNGGAPASYNTFNNGSNGGNSVFGSLTAIGGGGGGGRNSSGSNGGGGGGAGISGAGTGGSIGLGTVGQGKSGGAQSTSAPNFGGGGGGGAGSAGNNGTSTAGGDGGDGLQYDISGTNTYYAGGGGASVFFRSDISGDSAGTNGSGGLGGGGDVGADGTANTGGGGGGADRYPESSSGRVGGTGGSGIIIVSY